MVLAMVVPVITCTLCDQEILPFTQNNTTLNGFPAASMPFGIVFLVHYSNRPYASNANIRSKRFVTYVLKVVAHLQVFHNFVYRRCRGQRPQGAPECRSSHESLHIGGSGTAISSDFEHSRHKTRREGAHCTSNAGPITKNERSSDGEAMVLKPRR